MIIRDGSRTLAGSEVELFFIIVDGSRPVCHKKVYIRFCRTPGSASVYYNYTLGEISITSYCSDYIITYL